MTYSEWFEAHADRHKALVGELRARGMDDGAVIDYFDFDMLSETQPDFCPLFAEKRRCHDMPKLNCYLCACPYFRFDDGGLRIQDGVTVYSECAIDAREGKTVRFGDAAHQDCSACTLPHRRSFVEKHFDTEWKRIMSEYKTVSTNETDKPDV